MATQAAKVFYPTKSAWANARAADLTQQAASLSSQRGGDWRRRQARRQGVAHLYEEASRFRQMAARYQARGL